MCAGERTTGGTNQAAVERADVPEGHLPGARRHAPRHGGQPSGHTGTFRRRGGAYCTRKKKLILEDIKKKDLILRWGGSPVDNDADP